MPTIPTGFVWIRAFTDMQARPRALAALYGGPVWKAHGRQAAATMIDASDLLLLHPVNPPGGFDDLPATRPSAGSTAPSSLVIATIYTLRGGAAREFPRFFRNALRPALRDAGIVPRAAFETEHSPNNYPALAIRAGEDVFVWFASFDSAAAHRTSADQLARSRRWAHVEAELITYLESPPQQLRLRPTGALVIALSQLGTAFQAWMESTLHGIA